MKTIATLLATFAALFLPLQLSQANPVKIAVFDVDATPPLDSAMAYNPVKRIDELTLRCRGIVVIGQGQPIVLCAVDWIGIANEGHDAFRAALAEAANTTTQRVAVHTLHQHDAPGCDFTAERLIKELQIPGYNRYEGDFQRQVIQNASNAIRSAIPNATEASHYSYGEAQVEKVASNRRVEHLPGGRIGRMRGSASKVPELIALPEGTIDPIVSTFTFWNQNTPIAVLSYYACHPQSYYRVGIPSPDFPGIARFIRGQDVNSALHLHFNGAGGNVAAGKYNDGTQSNRVILATRLAAGMRKAYENSLTTKIPLSTDNIHWQNIPVKLPIAKHLNQADLIAKLKATEPKGYISYADQLAWLHRHQQDHHIDISCLKIGNARMLHLPGELFIEYQLAAKEMRPDLHVMMAAYGDYGPGYIGTAAAYQEGGYETGPTASSVAPETETVLINTIKKLLAD